jgi:concanavalin A-like lectin/glucanase superfamily protein
MRSNARLLLVLTVIAGCSTSGGGGSANLALRGALTFHVGFDGGADAGFAPGDGHLYTASGPGLKDPKPGLTLEGVSIAKGQGRYGDALRFEKKPKGVLFYKAAKNVSWSGGDFNGTVSFWLSLDPERDLEPGYCDPIQLTDKKWDDACLFVDFSKDEVPRLFRLGAFPDAREWNPQGRKFETIPDAERPMIVVKRHPFERGKWTHVAFTYKGFNTGREDAVARLYLNGELQGELSGKRTFSWDPSKAAIVIGVNYVGLYDDLAVFGRALGPEEIRELARLEGGVGPLVPQRRPLK